jgi:hypothetical protein
MMEDKDMRIRRSLPWIVLALGLLIPGCTTVDCEVDTKKKDQPELVIDVKVLGHPRWMLFWSVEAPRAGGGDSVLPGVELDLVRANRLVVAGEKESGWCYFDGTQRRIVRTRHRVRCPVGSSKAGFPWALFLPSSQALPKTVWFQAISFEKATDGQPQGEVELSNLCEATFIAR